MITRAVSAIRPPRCRILRYGSRGICTAVVNNNNPLGKIAGELCEQAVQRCFLIQSGYDKSKLVGPHHACDLPTSKIISDIQSFSLRLANAPDKSGALARRISAEWRKMSLFHSTTKERRIYRNRPG